MKNGVLQKAKAHWFGIEREIMLSISLLVVLWFSLTKMLLD